MNRLSRISVQLTVPLGILAQTGPASAQADPIGRVVVLPGSGIDRTSIRPRTSAGCPAKADAYYVKIRGHGFPADGQIVTSNISADLSHSFGFDVYFAQIRRDFAAQNHTTPSGHYDITGLCIDSFTVNSFGEFTGSLEFTSSTTYQALGAARPTGPSLPPRALAGDGSALDPHAAFPPAGAPAEPGLPGKAVEGQSVPPPVAQAPAAGNLGPVSVAGRFSLQRGGVAGGSARWLLVVVVLVVVVGLVGVVAGGVRKRRCS